MERSLEPVPRAVESPRRMAESWAPALTFALVLAAVAVALTTFHYSATGVWWLASAERMGSFEAAAPFQYRVLTSVLVASIHAVTSLAVDPLFMIVEVVFWMVLVVVAERALGLFDIGRSGLSRSCLAMTVMIPVAVHLILPDLRILSIFARDGAPFELGEWHLTALFRYVYDLPAAVFTLALVLVLGRFVITANIRWLACYMALFALATLNRETTVFLLPVFAAVCFRLLDHRTLAGLLLIQVAILVAIQAALHALFADNVNPHANVLDTAYENHLSFNLSLLREPAYLLVFLLRFGAGLYLPVLVLYRHLDPFLARTLLWFAVPFLMSALIFGRIQEHRVTVELVPLLWLAAVQAVTAYRAQRASGVSPDDDAEGLEAVKQAPQPRQVS